MKKKNVPMKAHVESQEASLRVSATCFGQESEDVRVIEVRPFIKGARVGAVTVKAGRTINLGNYESARVDVEFTAPGYREELVDLYHEVKNTTLRLLNEEVSSIESSFGLTSSVPSPEQSVDDLLS